jgi:hypothetical protein
MSMQEVYRLKATREVGNWLLVTESRLAELQSELDMMTRVGLQMDSVRSEHTRQILNGSLCLLDDLIALDLKAVECLLMKQRYCNILSMLQGPEDR